VRCEGATLHVALRPYEFQTLRIRLA